MDYQVRPFSPLQRQVADPYRIAQVPNSVVEVLPRHPRPTPIAESVCESLRSRPSTLTRTRISSRTTSGASSVACV